MNFLPRFACYKFLFRRRFLHCKAFRISSPTPLADAGFCPVINLYSIISTRRQPIVLKTTYFPETTTLHCPALSQYHVYEVCISTYPPELCSLGVLTTQFHKLVFNQKGDVLQGMD